MHASVLLSPSTRPEPALPPAPALVPALPPAPPLIAALPPADKPAPPLIACAPLAPACPAPLGLEPCDDEPHPSVASTATHPNTTPDSHTRATPMRNSRTPLDDPTTIHQELSPRTPAP